MCLPIMMVLLHNVDPGDSLLKKCFAAYSKLTTTDGINADRRAVGYRLLIFAWDLE